MNIQDYIKPELLVLIPVCWGLGLMIKSTPIDNRCIPAILCTSSVLLAGLYVSAAEPQTLAMGVFAGVTQGVICWLAAWLSYDKVIKKNGEE